MTYNGELPKSLNVWGNRKIADDLIGEMWGKRGVFTCTVANTMTSIRPGISDAGDTPDLTLFTPAADAELLVSGKITCMKGIPINPGGIPTPATLTKAALELSGMPYYIVNGGSTIKPYVPYFDMGGECGRDITSGDSVSNVKEGFEKGKILAESLARGYDYIVISESCAGGTTTALAVLMAMGTVKENLVSSSSPNNPKELKTKTVMEGLNAAGIKPGDLKDDPLRAIECVGDPMMPANVGMIIGAAKAGIPIIIGGGTQMAAVMAAAVTLDPSVQGRMFQGTTRWLMNDPNSSMVKLVSSISDKIPIVSVNMDYNKSPYEGLQAYEWGYIKEGVGCGGASVAAILGSKGEITCDNILDRVHSIYREIMGIQ
ncbi:MAG TPA: TIGR00303 family protein [Candidatus Methanomethylophilaceae archaeon]|nr:TIGR00303 family protein [Candidatus Methanomethylophilaceae archaeon]